MAEVSVTNQIPNQYPEARFSIIDRSPFVGMSIEGHCFRFLSSQQFGERHVGTMWRSREAEHTSVLDLKFSKILVRLTLNISTEPYIIKPSL